MMRVLIIEDDMDTASYISRGLAEEGHAVDHFSDGRDGLLQATTEDYDVIIVDRMLPGVDGLLWSGPCAASASVPVLFLTSLGGVDDRVDGLEVGGDDYLVKPFAFSELLARSTRSRGARRSRTQRRCCASPIWRWIWSPAPSPRRRRSICSRASFACWRS